jgi:hypothetical protein
LSGGTAFLHERSNRRGARLVIVEISSRGNWRAFCARVFVPATTFARPKELPLGTEYMEAVPPGAVIHLGQPDLNDRSHFTIQYKSALENVVVDGWLTDDDRVILEERKPELALVTP